VTVLAIHPSHPIFGGGSFKPKRKTHH
jgi:hypothetical protein